MKISIRSFVSLCAVYFLATGLALAEPAKVWILDGECGVLDENGDGVSSNPDEGVITDGVVISANNANGNVTFTCSLDQDRPLARRSVIFNYDILIELNYDDPDFDPADAECGLGPYGSTTDWHQVISASGKTKLTCHFHE